MTRILGIETSCDETAAAVVEDGRWVRSNVVASQHELHERYRGVVPEIASRAHLERILPVVEQALARSQQWTDASPAGGGEGMSRERLSYIDAVAVGNRPGLIGSLLVGVSAAQALAWATDKPLIGIDHVRAHLHAAWLRTPDAEGQASDGRGASQASMSDPPRLPCLGLVVSGGHTSLYRLDASGEPALLGRTIDDAVGEAYDKAAVILQLGYPGGPAVDQRAQAGDGQAYDLPRSMLGAESLDFSFSGLKTALLYRVRGKPRGRGRDAVFERSAGDLSERQRTDMAASFQAAAIDVLIAKLDRAVEQTAHDAQPPRCIVIGGGVSANKLLRRRALDFGRRRGLSVHLPAMAYCLDNAAMIAGLAHPSFTAGRFDTLDLPARATIS